VQPCRRVQIDPVVELGVEEEAGGVAKLIFNGTVQGSDIKFTLIWDSVTLYGKPPVGKEFLLKATKTAE
jgi:hypothetical protein